MSLNKVNPGFADRQKAALEARKAALDKFKARPGPGDPEYDRKQAERTAIVKAREEREKQRAIEKAKREAEEAKRRAEEAARLKAEEEARIAAEKAREEEEWLLKKMLEEEREAELKAKRDARYAARKAAKLSGRPTGKGVKFG